MKKYTVTLDPGHGGSDPGALSPNGVKESDMALDVMLRARTMLEPYVDVVMTRDTDRFISLTSRAGLSNVKNADVFVSYHFNSAASKAEGWEIFTTKGQNNSDKLADCIGKQHGRLFPNQRQRKDFSDGDLDKEANFSVIRRSACPAVLMEGEFIHTEKGERFITDDTNRHKMARAVAWGVLDFLGIEYNMPIKQVPLTVEQRLDRLEKLCKVI